MASGNRSSEAAHEDIDLHVGDEDEQRRSTDAEQLDNGDHIASTSDNQNGQYNHSLYNSSSSPSSSEDEDDYSSKLSQSSSSSIRYRDAEMQLGNSDLNEFNQENSSGKIRLAYRRNRRVLHHHHNLLSANQITVNPHPPPPVPPVPPRPPPSLYYSSSADERSISKMKKMDSVLIPSVDPVINSASTNSNPKRTCRFCHRQFPSGRALGGHMRIHGALASPDLFQSLPEPSLRHGDNIPLRSISSVSGSNLLNLQYTNLRRPAKDILTRKLNHPAARVLSGPQNSKIRPVQEIKLEADQRRLVGNTAFRSRNAGLQTKEGHANDKGINNVNNNTFSLPSVSAKGKAASNYSSGGDGDDGGEDADNIYDRNKNRLVMLQRENTANESESSSFDHYRRDAAPASSSLTNKIRQNQRPSRRLWAENSGATGDGLPEYPVLPELMQFSGFVGGLPVNDPIEVRFNQSSRRTNSQLFSHCNGRKHCPECGKGFWSSKALFGHMRCHPERDWRGTQKPEIRITTISDHFDKNSPMRKFAENSILDVNGDHQMGLHSDAENQEAKQQLEMNSTIKADEEATEEAEIATDQPASKTKLEPKAQAPAAGHLSSLTWPRGKRSRRSRCEVKGSCLNRFEPALSSETASSELQQDDKKLMPEEDEDFDMAKCLVLLSSATQEGEAANKADINKSVHSDSKQSGNQDQSTEIRGNQDDDDDDDGEQADNPAVPEEASKMNMKYECSTCKRCFNSHQALGGHRASHRKTRGCFAKTNNNVIEDISNGGSEFDDIDPDTDTNRNNLRPITNKRLATRSTRVELASNFAKVFSPSYVASNVKESTRPPTAKKKKLKGHECSICHRTFPSGQALGGHKRCHWTGDNKITDTASVASCSNNNNASTNDQTEDWSAGDVRESSVQISVLKTDGGGIDLNLPAPMDEDYDVDNNINESRFSESELRSKDNAPDHIIASRTKDVIHHFKCDSSREVVKELDLFAAVDDDRKPNWWRFGSRRAADNGNMSDHQLMLNSAPRVEQMQAMSRFNVG